jgi:hypothetical protein
LKAKEKELGDREAKMVNQRAEQSDKNDQGATDNGADGGDDSGNGTDSPDADDNAESDGDDASDPGAALAADFGEDFVQLITALIKQVVGKGGGDASSKVAATVDQLIKELRDERQQNHFKAIAAAHADFMEVTDSKQFKDWVDSQSPDDQANAKRVIDSGSSDEIVALLTQYKQSLTSGSDADDSDGDDDDGADAAAGVRSSGLRLPDAPSAGADDYAAAWNEA